MRCLQDLLTLEFQPHDTCEVFETMELQPHAICKLFGAAGILFPQYLRDFEQQIPGSQPGGRECHVQRLNGLQNSDSWLRMYSWELAGRLETPVAVQYYSGTTK